MGWNTARRLASMLAVSRHVGSFIVEKTEYECN